MDCPACQIALPSASKFCPQCGANLTGSPYASPAAELPASAAADDPNYGGVIPYKNPKALISYYLGLFSLLPIIGFFLGAAALILGIMGLRDRSKRPEIKGHVHAGIGIGCGALTTLIWGFAIVSMILTLALNTQQ